MFDRRSKSINLAQDFVILFVFICAFLLASKNNADDDGLFGNRVIRCVAFLTNKVKHSTKKSSIFSQISVPLRVRQSLNQKQMLGGKISTHRMAQRDVFHRPLAMVSYVFAFLNVLDGSAP